MLENLFIEMPYISVEKAYCVLQYARTRSVKTLQRIFVCQRFEKRRVLKSKFQQQQFGVLYENDYK